MGIIGELKRDKSGGGSHRSAGATSQASSSSSSTTTSSRPLSGFWGGLGKSSPSSKAEPVVPKGYKLKSSAYHGGSTGHLDYSAYNPPGFSGGMRPAVSMPVVALPAAPQKSSKQHPNAHYRNSLPPLVGSGQRPLLPTTRPTPRMVKKYSFFVGLMAGWETVLYRYVISPGSVSLLAIFCCVIYIPFLITYCLSIF